jgi:prepilin-type processing-associated H-X9-DG protein
MRSPCPHGYDAWRECASWPIARRHNAAFTDGHVESLKTIDLAQWK